MRELKLLDQELAKAKTTIVYRKDIRLYRTPLATEMASTLRSAEAEAKRKKIGQATVLVILHEPPDPPKQV